MHSKLHVLRVIATGLLLLGILLWVMFRSLKKSDDPARLIFKWFLTGLGLAYMIFFVGPMISQGGYGAAFGGVPAAAVGGLFFAIVWRHNIANMIAKPFGSIYDGGDEEVDAKPYYSAAQAHRKRGHYREAIAEIRAQLAKFPDNFEGQLLMAEIQAENLNDLPATELTIQRLCNQPGHAPKSVAFALNSLADWHLKFGQDREAARLDLERIIERFPDSEMSAVAAQRIAHLTSTAQMLSPHDRRKIVVTPGVEDIGLLEGAQQPRAPEVNYEKLAADYVKQLQMHPLDTEARENLAVIYANQFNRLDLATDQLEQLITHPNQPLKRVAHWLNLLADLQIKHGAKHETVAATLQRIIDLFPNTGPAGQAATRLAHLRLELKGKEKSQAVKLGSYEEDIGLKGGRLPDQL
ncbi:MAG: tetratricopeptide repeat protein [Verrucomicrobiota bacterium]